MTENNKSSSTHGSIPVEFRQYVVIDRFISQAATIWTIVLLFYLALAVVITAGMRLLERWAAALVGRPAAPRRSVRALFRRDRVEQR